MFTCVFPCTLEGEEGVWMRAETYKKGDTGNDGTVGYFKDARQISQAQIEQKALCQPAGTCLSCKGWGVEGTGRCAPGVPAESKSH